MENKNDTLNGGRIVAAVFQDGRKEEILVRQLPTGEWTKTFPLVDDEFALVAAVCAKPRADIEALTPDSYEKIQADVQEVNAKGFFAFVKRQMDKGQKNISNMIAAGIPLEQVMVMLKESTLRTPSPGSPARRV